MKKIFLIILLIFNLRIFAQSSTQLYETGASYAKSGDFENASKYFKETIKISPYYCMGHYGLGKLNLYNGGDLKVAEKELLLATKLDKRFAKAHFYLGVAYMLREKYLYSIKSFKKAYESDKSYFQALYNIGAVYDLMGHPFKSYNYYKKYYVELEKEKSDFFEF